MGASRAAWLAWQLRGDQEAGRLFTGENCGLCEAQRMDSGAEELPCRA